MRAMLALTLRKGGYDVDAAEGGEAALALLAAESYDAVLTDVRMPGMDGIELLRRARAMGVEAPVIVMSAYGSLDLALDAMKAGAYDYVSKPFKRDEVLLALRKAEERERLRREVRNLRALAGRTYSEGAPVFAGERMRAVLETAERVAAYKTTVLLRGESGVGKEVLARFIHLRSPRADGPFVAVNCGAIPESLIESELFGHARGAFTDAARAKPGLFEEAGGGTLFLDEVAELPRSAQAALLRALQESEVRRVGELRPREVDVRILAATARDLEAEIAAGGFREDLFYRLNVVPLRIPALRERPEDVPALAERFIAKACGERGIAPKRVAPAAMEALRAYA
ncbi:MAG: sigma-54 dependent transcriptional regulator, partial [Candidatus Methylomirabilis sp.]|nr:sigma-54 dependent transcriptional regulator [Deltaproteobacteria bacterium]